MTRPATTPPAAGSGLVAAPTAPPPGRDYTAVLADPASVDAIRQVRGAVGIVVAGCLYVITMPLVCEAVVALGWIADGRPARWGTYLPDALAFRQPWGLLGTNLGLACLIGIACAMVRFLHGVRPRWLCSVQPGMRWRYLVACLPVALVVLGAMQLVGGAASPSRAQARVALYLVIVVLTSPLQAAGEEFLFRGYLMQAIGSVAPSRWGARAAQAVAVVASALVFALAHGVQNPALFVDRLGFGLLAGALVVVTGGLEAGIACHVVNNLMAFGWAAFHGGIAGARGTTMIGWEQAAVDVIAFAIFAVVAALVAHRMRVARSTPATPGR